MARSFFEVASFNVRNLVNQDVPYYSNKGYDGPAYNRKLNWLAEQLFRMDSDIVCLQEVFHEEALNDLVTRYHKLLAERSNSERGARLKHYDNVRFQPNLKTSEDNPYPGLAILSRRNMLDYSSVQDISDNPISISDDDDLTYNLSMMSRPVQFALIDLGKGVSGWVFNAHLKSKIPRFEKGDPAEKEENGLFLERTAGVFRSLALRAGEALAFRREILNKMVGSEHPTLVVGDFNDEIGAVTTEMIAGEAPWRRLPSEVKKIFWDVELYSAARIHLRRSEHASLYTHIHNGHYGTIDHVLVSQEFYYRNRERLGEVHFVQCYNDHLSDDSIDGAPSLGDASDHGQLKVRISINDQSEAEV